MSDQTKALMGKLGRCNNIFQKRANESWLTDETKSARRFSWGRNGDYGQPLTMGIWIWSEPFLVKLMNGEDVVVLLMDCQGFFAAGSKTKTDATIFALSALLSSFYVSKWYSFKYTPMSYSSGVTVLSPEFLQVTGKALPMSESMTEDNNSWDSAGKWEQIREEIQVNLRSGHRLISSDSLR